MNALVSVISVLTTLPLFIVLYKWLPRMDWPYHSDKLLLYLVVFGVVQLFVLKFKKMILLIAAFIFVLLSIGSFSQRIYSHRSLIQDYIAMLYTSFYDPVGKKIDLNKLNPFPNERAIRRAINYTNPVLRNFSIRAVNKHFREKQKGHKYRTIIQSMAVFKEINTQWNYVNDPKSRDYFAKASESALLLAGDCDDHSILMAAAIKSIGGTTRLILTTRHIYPELLIGDKNDLEQIVLLVARDLFESETKKRPLHYHIDKDGKVWINLDYTAPYPGGKFLAEPILGIMYP